MNIYILILNILIFSLIIAVLILIVCVNIGNNKRKREEYKLKQMELYSEFARQIIEGEDIEEEITKAYLYKEIDCNQHKELLRMIEREK